LDWNWSWFWTLYWPLELLYCLVWSEFGRLIELVMEWTLAIGLVLKLKVCHLVVPLLS
jgi:hypothetical protein